MPLWGRGRGAQGRRLLPVPLSFFCFCLLGWRFRWRPRGGEVSHSGEWGTAPESENCSHREGCAFTYGAYAMPDRWVDSTLHQYFVPVAALNTFVCTGLSCYTRFLELECPRLSKVLRTSAFVYPFMFDNIPLFYRLLFCFGEDCSWNTATPLHIYHLFFALLTGFLFASHLPERLAPGRFDYFGHSHQLFHICAVVGTHFQMEAVLTDMNVRRPWLTSHTPLPSSFGTLGIMSIAVVGNLLAIGGFTGFLLWSPRAGSILQSTVPEETKVKEH